MHIEQREKLASLQRRLERMPAEVINATEKNKLAIPYYVGTLALGIPAIFLGLQIAGWIGFVRIIADGTAISVSSISLGT